MNRTILLRISTGVMAFLPFTNAFGMVGNAPIATTSIARHIVLISSSRGNFCTGVVIAHRMGCHQETPSREVKA